MFRSEKDKGDVYLLDERYNLNKFNKYIDEDFELYIDRGV